MADPSPEPAIDLLFLLNQASYALTAEMNAALTDVGISIRDYCVLWKALDGDRTQKEIAEATLLDKTTMVTTLDALEAAGLATRRPSPTDRRARLVSVTPAGRKVITAGKRIIDNLVADVLAHVSGGGSALVDGLSELVDDRLASPSHVPGPRRRAASPGDPTKNKSR